MIGETRAAARQDPVSAQDPPGPAISVRGLRFSYGDREVLRGVDLDVAAGEFVALVGTNGCGKSTLLRLVSGLLAPAAGSVRLAGRDVAATSRREISRRVAVLHQTLPPVPGLTARQLVRQGRFPHRGALGMLWEPDDGTADAAMAAAGVAHLADRALDTLSGGERQRVRLALAVAQDAPVLLLDEPTAHLDVRHQLEVLALVRELRDRRGLTVVTVLHELDHAARFADRVVALAAGRVHADGPPAQVITPALLAEVFGVRGRVLHDSGRDAPYCLLDEPIA
ncbi:ABC transporter ATP-binding protein [Bailinhaonella thermotolerans]|uniref:ABC transporter ATP-binding protein n=1 Tax=Bailinhaonella thermotolerans TaxID=1070861 RepID=A0A3A4ABP5_9ACTN|nr:ABC transporter ATP-binding protein [Bailinhaonella thermotolerans]RJL24227.1 ABC transporter ATP-binding protein [Bailinhaonella thermotolerans]